MLAAIAVGLAVGAWQGFWVAYVGIPAFIVTLAGMLLFRGLTQQVLGNISLSPFPAEYGKVASGFLNGLLGGDGYDVFTLLIGALAVAGYAFSGFRTRLARIKYQQPVESFPLFVARVVLVGAVVMYFAWQLAHARGLPIVLIILGVLVLAYGVISKRSVFGRQIYAIGGNLAAAQLSGVKVKVVNFWIFVNMGFLSAVAGIIYSSRSNGAQPSAGNMFELDAIAAVLHRRRGGHRRRRHGRRRHGRRPDHGRDEQRHAAHGRGAADPVGHQGPRPAAGRRVRRLQQASRRRVPLKRRPGESRPVAADRGSEEERCSPRRPRPGRW